MEKQGFKGRVGGQNSYIGLTLIRKKRGGILVSSYSPVTNVCMCNSSFILNGNSSKFIYFLITTWRLAYYTAVWLGYFWRSYSPFWLEIFHQKLCTCNFSNKWEFLKALQAYLLPYEHVHSVITIWSNYFFERVIGLFNIK